MAALAEEVAIAFEPLVAAFSSDGALRDFLELLGWDFDVAPPELNTLRDPVMAVWDFVEDGPADNSQVLPLLGAESAAFDAIEQLGNMTTLPDDFRSAFPKELVDYLIVDDLLRRQAGWAYLLMLLGLLRLDETDAEGSRPAHLKRVLLTDQIGQFLTNPLDFWKASYAWGQSDFDGRRLVLGLEGFLDAWGLNVRSGILDPQMMARLTGGVLTTDEFFQTALRLILLDGKSRPRTTAGVGMFLLAETASEKPGFSLLPFASESFDEPLPLNENLTLRFLASVDLAGGVGLLVRPDQDVQGFVGLASSGPSALNAELGLRLELRDASELDEPREPIVALGHKEGTRLEFAGASIEGGARRLSQNAFEVFTEVAVQDGKIVVKPAADEADGFLAEVLPANGFELDFDLTVGFSTERGMYFRGSAGFELPLPVHIQLGPLEIIGGLLRVRFADGEIPVDLAASIRADFSILKVVVQDIGLTAKFTFPEDKRGNLGAANLALAFKAPDGAGLTVDAGPVTGGGFLFFDNVNGRYAGVVALSVFSVSVKAFGLIETKLPDGTPGFSFVIVIIAEFTPIQLGFGFTLLGVGGLVGVNRSIAEQALGDAVRTGSLEHLLFPQNVVEDAPAIIHDLATVFPAAKGHFIVGPMAKLGWGTPTLISAELGIILEFPGPRLALLGLVRMALPSPDAAIVRLQMGISGLLDFPAKKVSVDASLFDSTVAGFVVTGDMAYRMQFGDKASFLLSVGGFNPGFQAPSPFPKLRRAAVDFGIHGNPSLVASGYFALTSNTAQIGASIELHASGFGIHLDGWLGFDVMFVFSPFSFDASISAGVRVSFHGVGFGITLHGSLSGPNPWHLKGKVCVSVLWWDACLPVDVTFGDREPAALPEMDPWVGDASVPVVGLSSAISDARNWQGSALPSEFKVVALSAAATADRAPIDPLGAATLRQKVAPFNRKLEKFGEYKPKDHDQFSLGPGVGTVLMNDAAVNEIELVEDDFVPGHFMQLTNAQKLSLPSYEPMDAGISVAPNRTSLGSSSSRIVEYVTKYIDDQRVLHEDQPRLRLTQAQLDGLLTRSAAALGGVRRAGTEKYMLPGRPKKIQLGPRAYVVADACTLVRNTAITGTEVSQSQAVLALNAHLAQNPLDRGRFAVVPVFEERAA